MDSIKKMIVLLIPIIMFSGKSSINRLINIGSSEEYSLFYLLVLLMFILMLVFQQLNRINISTILLINLWFILVIFVSLSYTPNLKLGIEKTLALFLVFFLIFLCYQLIVTEKDFEILLLGFYLISLSIAIIAIPQLMSQTLVRVSVLGGGPNVFGRFMFIGLLTSIYFTKKERYNLIFLRVTSLIFLIMLIASGSRGVMVASIAVVIVYALLNFGKIFNTRNVKPILILLILAVVFIWVFKDILIYYYESRFSNMFSDVSGGSAIFAREMMYAEAFSFFKEHPYFGKGISSFAAITRFEVYPHNIFLEAMSELGIMGLVPLITIISIYCNSAFKIIRKKDNNILIYFVYFVLFFFVSAQFSGDFYDSRFMFLFGTLMTKFKFLNKEWSD